MERWEGQSQNYQRVPTCRTSGTAIASTRYIYAADAIDWRSAHSIAAAATHVGLIPDYINSELLAELHTAASSVHPSRSASDRSRIEAM